MTAFRRMNFRRGCFPSHYEAPPPAFVSTLLRDSSPFRLMDRPTIYQRTCDLRRTYLLDRVAKTTLEVGATQDKDCSLSVSLGFFACVNRWWQGPLFDSLLSKVLGL